MILRAISPALLLGLFLIQSLLPFSCAAKETCIVSQPLPWNQMWPEKSLEHIRTLIVTDHRWNEGIAEIKKFKPRSRAETGMLLTMKTSYFFYTFQFSSAEETALLALKEPLHQVNRQFLLKTLQASRESLMEMKLKSLLNRGKLTKREFETGLEELRVLQKLASFSFKSCGAIATYLSANERAEEALQQYVECLKRHPECAAELYGAMGAFELVTLRDKKAAMKDLSRSIDLGSTNIATYVLRSDLAKKWLLPDLALSDLNKAIKLSPADPSLYEKRANVYEFLMLEPELAEKDRLKKNKLLRTQSAHN